MTRLEAYKKIRKPLPPPTQRHKSKVSYTRKPKHKKALTP